MPGSPNTPQAEPRQPTMDELRMLRDAIEQHAAFRRTLEYEIATLDAQNVGFPTLADADIPRMHWDFARAVVDTILECVDRIPRAAPSTEAAHV